MFLFGRWPALRSLNLTNVSCSVEAFDGASGFLYTHLNLEVLHLDVGRSVSSITLPPNSLPRLRELKSSKDFANTVMACPSEFPRPLETLKGMRLSGQAWDLAFLKNLRRYPVKRLELVGYNEFEDIKRLVDSVPRTVWLDVGKKANATHKAGPAVIYNVVRPFSLLCFLHCAHLIVRVP